MNVKTPSVTSISDEERADGGILHVSQKTKDWEHYGDIAWLEGKVIKVSRCGMKWSWKTREDLSVRVKHQQPYFFHTSFASTNNWSFSFFFHPEAEGWDQMLLNPRRLLVSHIIPGNLNMDFTDHVLADSCQKSEKIFFKTLLAYWLKYLTYRATEICNHKNILLRTGRRLKDSRVWAHLFSLSIPVFTQTGKTQCC